MWLKRFGVKRNYFVEDIGLPKGVACYNRILLFTVGFFAGQPSTSCFIKSLSQMGWCPLGVGARGGDCG